MKKVKVIQSAVMCVISILILIGFTVAWFSGGLGDATAGGMRMKAAEQGDIKIALESGGADISRLEEENSYVDIGLEKLTNIEFIQKDENGTIITDENQNPMKVWKMAPGAYGEVVFYITPLKQTVGSCSVLPEVRLEKEDGTVITKGNSVITVSDGKGNTAEVNVYEIANEHIIFYYYKEGESTPTLLKMKSVTGENETETLIRESAQFPLVWDSTADAGKEKKVTLYWKWDYEYPSDSTKPTYRELLSYSGFTQEQKENLYDEHDTILGNYIDQMSFHFDFTALPGTSIHAE